MGIKWRIALNCNDSCLGEGTAIARAQFDRVRTVAGSAQRLPTPLFLSECAPAQKLASSRWRDQLHLGAGYRRSEERLDPVFVLKGQRGFDPEYKRLGSIARPSVYWNERDCPARHIGNRTYRRLRLHFFPLEGCGLPTICQVFFEGLVPFRVASKRGKP